MLFFPNGVMPGEVVDPDKLAQEFLEAASLAGQTGQWQWKEDILTRTLLRGVDVCRVEQTQINCDLQSVQGAEPILPDDAGADANIWKIPFKRGFQPIGEGTTHGTLDLQWSSSYPELVLIVLTCQYVRELEACDAGMNPADPCIRIQTRIQLDGAILPGTGPFGNPIYTVRGTGYGQSTAALSTIYVGVIPAGTHVVQGVAAQADNAQVDAAAIFRTAAPVEKVCIGTRNLFVVRFPRGDQLVGA
jgi:hypothetical protein